jgi:hypothetical protein
MLDDFAGVRLANHPQGTATFRAIINRISSKPLGGNQ